MVNDQLLHRFSYKNIWVDDIEALRKNILNKTVVPHQVEIQPGREKGRALCWLSCPYCYGGAAANSKERLTISRYIEILDQIHRGGVDKLVFAGYATDPMNYEHIDTLLEQACKFNQTAGFHTKALKVSARFIDLITSGQVGPKSYFSVSIDAGTNESYLAVHGKYRSQAKLLDRVVRNLDLLVQARANTGAKLDICTTYLVTRITHSDNEILGAIRRLKDIGVDSLRFTFPQVPRGYTKQDDDIIPNKTEINVWMERIKGIAESETTRATKIIILDPDSSNDIYRKERTLPCFSRFIFPSIGFDGHLYHCSESSSPDFRKMSFGNLANTDFWDLYYRYDPEHFDIYMQRETSKMANSGCRCDRKEHIVNSLITRSKVFDDILGTTITPHTI